MFFKNRTVTGFAIMVLTTSFVATPQTTYAGDSVPHWGAVAIGSWNSSDGGAYNTAAVSTNYSTKQKAINAAMKSCSSDGGQNCSVTYTFSNGQCWYASLGKNSDGVGGGFWITPKGAKSNCEKQGYHCKKPVGGCNSK